MDKLITLLTSFFSLPKVASVSVPGIIAATAVAILMFPSSPVDIIPFLERSESEDPSCRIKPLAMEEAINNRQFAKVGSKSVKEQLVLDTMHDRLAECVEKENSLKGEETTENAQLVFEIEVLKKDEADIQTAYQGYVKSNNSLQEIYRTKYAAAASRIADVNKRIRKNEQTIRDHDRTLAELTRQSSVIADRLKDPGRLRPRRAIDDILAAIASHAIAFALLTIAVGILVTPVTRTIGSIFYDNLFE